MYIVDGGIEVSCFVSVIEDGVDLFVRYGKVGGSGGVF